MKPRNRVHDIEVGKRLKQCRMDKKITRKALAEACDISPQHVYNIETGLRGLSLEKAIAFSKYIGVPKEMLLYGETEQPPEFQYELFVELFIRKVEEIGELCDAILNMYKVSKH